MDSESGLSGCKPSAVKSGCKKPGTPHGGGNRLTASPLLIF